jgi:peroxiredoxin
MSKKNIIIWSAAIILVIIAIYTTNNYNNKTAAANNPPQQTPAAEQAAPTPADSSQSGGQSSSPEIDLMKDYDFTLEDLKGNKVTLSELRGKKVFLNFWATWCTFCVKEMPDMEKLYQETKDGDLVMLAINVGEDKKTVQDFVDKNKFSYTILLDTTGEISQLYQVSGLPTSYFIDTHGHLANGAGGAIPLEKMKEIVDALE